MLVVHHSAAPVAHFVASIDIYGRSKDFLPQRPVEPIPDGTSRCALKVVADYEIGFESLQKDQLCNSVACRDFVISGT